MDNDLYFTILDTTAVRTNAMHCFRCKPYEHELTSCPFPLEYQTNKSSKRYRKDLRSGSIMEMKDVITINLENATSQIVVEHMSAKGVEGPIHEVDAQHVIRYSSPLNVINPF